MNKWMNNLLKKKQKKQVQHQPCIHTFQKALRKECRVKSNNGMAVT